MIVPFALQFSKTKLKLQNREIKKNRKLNCELKKQQQKPTQNIYKGHLNYFALYKSFSFVIRLIQTKL